MDNYRYSDSMINSIISRNINITYYDLLKLSDNTKNIISRLIKKIEIQKENYNKINNKKNSYSKKSIYNKKNGNYKNNRHNIFNRNNKLNVENRIRIIGNNTDKIIQDFRLILNKITIRNYEKMYNELEQHISINNIILCKNNSIREDTYKIFLDIIQLNETNMNIYCKIFLFLLDEIPEYKEYLLLTIKEYFYYYDKLKYYDPEEFYDDFCEQNNMKNKQKKILKFLIELCLVMNSTIVDKRDIQKSVKKQNIEKYTIYIHSFFDIFSELLIKINDDIHIENYRIYCDEYIDDLSIITKRIDDIMMIDDSILMSSNKMIDNCRIIDDKIVKLREYGKYKNTDLPVSLSMKSKFTLMDI